MKPFLVDNKELGREFRDLFLERLSKLVEQGKITLEETGYIADLLGELRLNDWVAFIEGPPKPDCPPSQMLKYLTRYLTGGPISNRRIVGEKGGRVYFKARSKRKGEGQVLTSLPKVEFVHQWCLHILPKDYTKTRHFGAWSGSKRRIYLVQCTELAPATPTASTTQSPISHAAKTESTETPQPEGHRSCPHCRGEMECVLKQDRPRWRELFYGPEHPEWFEWTSMGKCSPPDNPPPLGDNDLNTKLDIKFDIFDEIIARRQS